jgi:DNA repair exonuclease SbcCD ATPase subunit
MEKDIFCLAGANGLGKSSFIAALNYALTGGVAPPNGKVDQLPQYRRDASNYSLKYFTGRISETDRPSARIGVRFRVGDRVYEIRRRFFSPAELESFSVVDTDGQPIVVNDPDMDAEERHHQYEQSIVADVGLQTFAQYVFLQHFVFSFDERRHLLFWNNRATELVLYLALGLDPNLAKQVDELRKAASAAGSGARNAQYQATLARNQLTQLRAQLRGTAKSDAGVLSTYEGFQREREELTAARNAVRTELSDSRLEFAEASAIQMRKRQEYEQAFRQRVVSRPGVRMHAIIAESLADHLCRVCGTQHQTGPAAITEAIDAGHCPLCSAELAENSAVEKDDPRATLVRLDAELSEAAERVHSLNQTILRLDAEQRNLQQQLATVISAMKSLEDEHAITPGHDVAEDKDLQERIKQLEGTVEVQLGRKEDQLELRARALDLYEPIQRQLKAAWNEAEVEFVPRFRYLAEAFIGLPLQIGLDAGSGISGTAHLALMVNSTHRRTAEQLSESQRFFLDIALRMSLAQHMTGDTSPSCLLIDTPEGALDIAYEARAGDMFATFAGHGDQIIMTANVNTSQLLKRMAARCGHPGMKLVRMTEWTTLSDVQSEEEALFTEAFDAIEAALDAGPIAPAPIAKA